MQNEGAEFRERLLGAQPMTPGLRDEYRRELEGIQHHRLTPWTRALTVGAMLVAVVFAVACVRQLVVHQVKPGVRIVLPTYAAIFSLAALWLGRALWKGGFAHRASFAAVEWLGGIMVGVYVGAIMFHSMFAPSDPASTYQMVWAVMFAMVGFAWSTGNRIAAAKLETREHLLRIESRLADLAEKTAT